MPIQLSLPQPTGVTATYHKVVGYNGGDTSLVATVASYLSADTFNAGNSPILTQSVEVGFVLEMPSSNPPAGATIKQVVYGILENALVAQQSPQPDGTVTNGIFFGGTTVA